MPDSVDVYWLGQSFLDIPGDDAWLSHDERSYLARLRFPKRHDDWMLGRWTAKRAVALRLGLALTPGGLAAIEIRPALSGAPEVWLSGAPANLILSLSHSAGRAMCVVSASKVQLGCDLETIEPRSDGFLADYFTGEEQAQVAEAPIASKPLLATLLWSAKESALKALREGLRLDTRRVEVSHIQKGDSSDWNAIQVHFHAGQLFHGWWKSAGSQVQTLVADPRPGTPISLQSLEAFSGNGLTFPNSKPGKSNHITDFVSAGGR
jgi:4'-phosphopantetheinyl transferase